MSFNYDEFNSLKTKATDAKLNSLSRNVKRLKREDPPLRGFATKGRKDPALAVQFYQELVDALFDYIKSSNDLTDEQREHFLVGEKFQSEQKGPAAPVLIENIYEKVYEPLIHPNNIVIDQEAGEVGLQEAERFANYLKPYCKIDIKNINYKDEGSKLPSSTVRGFPYHALGAECDDVIMERGGESFSSAFQFFMLSNQLVCFPGGRIQGKPWPGPAKVRIVMIPCVFYQYLIVGIVSQLMSQLKTSDFFDGWKQPLERAENIVRTIDTAKSRGGVIIQLDFSAFDKDFDKRFRVHIGRNVGAKLMRPCPEVDMFLDRFEEYVSNQYLFMGKLNDDEKGRDYMLVDLINQLTSGVKNTQLDGSGVNAVNQATAVKLAFDVEIDFAFSRGLGDDAALPVPMDKFVELGYEGVLEVISKAFSRLGFTVNPKKAYPNSDLAFLQKLYVPDCDIKGAGTGARSMASFLFKEKYTEEIPGIKNLAALEIISQISIMTEAFALIGKDLRGFAPKFAERGLQEDDGLRYIIQSFFDIGLSDVNDFFKYLVKLTGLSYDQILDYNDALSYDHTGLSTKLHSSEYDRVFPILKYLLESEANRIPVRSKVKDLFDSAELVVSDEVNPEDMDTD